jgi:hypothetical protein
VQAPAAASFDFGILDLDLSIAPPGWLVGAAEGNVGVK